MKFIKLSTLVLIALFTVINVTMAQEGVKEERIGLKVKPTVKLHGRIQYDFEFLSQKSDIDGIDDYKLKGQEFRRVYLEAGGTIFKNIKYKAQVEFVGGQVAYRDMYIKFVDLPYIGGNLALGSVAEATGIDMATSSKYISFIERSMITSTQAFRWNSGIHYSNFGILDGKIGLQASYAFNGNHAVGFKDKAIGEGGHIVARLTSPIFKNKEKNQLIHVGINYENRNYSGDPADKALKFRPENHMGYKVSVPFDSLKTQSDIGFEVAAIFGPFSFQAEYEIAKYQTVAKDYTVNGYYAALTYFVTGGRRGFKKGAGSRVKPFNNFCIKDGNFGALELVARYSVLDYSDTVEAEFGDKVSNITAGFNWYLNSHARIMYNYVISDFNNDGDNNKLNANLIRFQIDF